MAMYSSSESSGDTYVKPKNRKPTVSLAWLRDVVRSGKDKSLENLVRSTRRGPRLMFTDERALFETLLSRDF